MYVSYILLIISQILKWDMNETKIGGPFKAMTQVDVLCNCIFLSPTQKPKPFLTHELLAEPNRKLTVVCDVSCDPNNPNNPILIPNYSSLTKLTKPTKRCIEATEYVTWSMFLIFRSQPALDVIAIDHLPALVPLESSIDYSSQMFPHFKTFPEANVWKNALLPFVEKTAHLR